MIDYVIEQQIIVKFYVLLGKTATETFSSLRKVYGSKCLSLERVSEWFDRVQDGCDEVEGDGLASTSKTEENVGKIGNLVRTDRQRVVLKFHVKLGKTATETFSMLKQVYGNKCLARSTTYQWFKRFQAGRDEIEDNARCGRPSTSKSEENIAQIRYLLRSDSRLSLRMISETIEISRESVRQVLQEHLNVQKVSSKIVPKNLPADQKETRRNFCTDTMNYIKKDPDFLKRVITYDASWFYICSSESKFKSSMQGNSLVIKRARLSKSKSQAMMIVFFDIHGVVHYDWVPDDETITENYYLNVLAELCEKMKEKRPELWKDNSWFLHQENTPVHNALSVKTFLAKHSIPVLEHPPHSPDIAPFDFYLFPKLKTALKGSKFESVEALKAKVELILKELPEIDFQNCFEQWQSRMGRCRDGLGVYIEGENNESWEGWKCE